MNFTHSNLRSALSICVIALLVFFMTINVAAQSIVSGDITGTVTDPSGAIVPGATVTLKNLDTGATQTTTTNQTGFYRFSLLKPGRYTVTLSQQGFQSVTRNVAVAVGQATRADIALSVGQSTQTVEVTAETPVVQTDNGNISTSYNAREIEALPNPGGDTTYIAQTAPGVTMNTGGGYGNFSAYGLPATSNLYTVNGNDNMDPYLNLNNSGATNLTLGANELAETTIVENGYSGNYGRQAGAQVNATTKSGSNQFHGNAIYFWNGRAMNANTWFNKYNATNDPAFVPTDRPFVNANQWAASIGGPIVKDKLFFFVNTEGLRVVLPTSQNVYIPSPAFQQYTLSQGLAAGGNTASGPFYQQMFNLFNSAPGAQSAVPATDLAVTDPTTNAVIDPGGCEGLGNTLGAPCLSRFRSNAGNFTREWILSGRVDFNLSNSNKMFARIKTDHGVQATYTDPISPIFNAFSTQPQWEGQLNLNSTLTSNLVNQFIMSGSYYSAMFNTNDRAGSLQAFPTTLFFNTAANLGGINASFPQGRNVTQYQFIDDVSWNKGAHTFKFGVGFRRNDISDMIFGVRTSGRGFIFDMADYAQGFVDLFQQRFPQKLSQPIAIYGLGGYVSDQWRVTKNLRLDLSLRADHGSNPVCHNNCFYRTVQSWDKLSHDPNVPYNQLITPGQEQAFPSTDVINWQPRLGFAWSPLGNDKTVLRGGIGIFYDSATATVVDNYARNSPGVNSFSVAGPISPDQTNNVFTLAQQYNQLFSQGFAGGATLASLAAQSAAMGLPTFKGVDYNVISGDVRTPQFQEWSLELQQEIGAKSSISAKYVGNHGIHIPITNSAANAYCLSCTPGFTGLPATPTEMRFRNVNELRTGAVSNSNALTLQFMRKYSKIQWTFNYTWAHALDEISNGGVLPYSNDSVIGQIDPNCLRCLNYSNADYDVRHLITANYVWDPGFHFENGAMNQVLGGWTIAGTVFWHTGYPYTVFNSNAPGYFGNFATGTLTGNFLGGPVPDCTNPRQQCLNPTPNVQFTDPNGATAAFGNTRRNQFRGPGFFDTDLSVTKNFKLTEALKFGIGANVFNLFNHPNFANPVGDLASSNFGTIQSTVSPPTTPLGAFLASDASFRMIQLTARITF